MSDVQAQEAQPAEQPVAEQSAAAAVAEGTATVEQNTVEEHDAKAVTSHAADVYAQIGTLLNSEVFKAAIPVVLNYLCEAEADPALFTSPAALVKFATQFITDLTESLPAIDKSALQSAAALMDTIVAILQAKGTAPKVSSAY